MKRLWNPQNVSIFATLLVALILFFAASLRYNGFMSLPVLVNLIDDNAFLGVAAVGMTFVILSGGIDLSVGSMIGFTSILSAILVERYQMHPVMAAGLMLLIGAAVGSLMGFFISYFEMEPFLVTLAGMFFLRGLAYSLSQESIALTHPWYQWFLKQSVPLGSANLPPTGLLFLVIVLAGMFVAGQTGLGRTIYAIGGNIQSSRLMGLRVFKTQILIYLISGMLSALAGVTYTMYTSAGNATAAMGLELDVIAAVVIGGTLLTGGRGSVFGTMIGVFILGTIQTIITFEGTLSSWWTRIVIGVLLFLFVGLQRGLAKLGHRKWTLPKNILSGNRGLRRATAVGVVALATLLASFSTLAKTCPAGQLQGQKLEDGLYQLTGTQVVPGEIVHSLDELPDPAPPYINAKGEVEIYGSAPYFIRYKNWTEFSEGGCYEIVKLNLQNPNFTAYNQKYSHPWDLRKFRVDEKGTASKEIIIGGAMSATDGAPAPVWPKDNINRRIYFFRLDQIGRWVRDLLPIVGSVNTGWIGHSYGGNLIQEDSPSNVVQADTKDRPIGFFYERVSDDTGNSPYKTEIFASLMSSVDRTTGPEITIFKIGNNPYPSVKRTGGGLLAEGPRPIQVSIQGQKFFLIGFSTGDFPTDSYHINFLWSRTMMGPYTPFLTADQSDLMDFGSDLKKRYRLSWLGRPALFQTPTGEYEMLFHGVRIDILPNNDYAHWPSKYNLWDFFRCIFKSKVELSLDTAGNPVMMVKAEPVTKGESFRIFKSIH